MLFGNFANYGFVRDTVPIELLNNLKNEVSELNFKTAEQINTKLAGNISKEFKLSKNRTQLETYVKSLCASYSNTWPSTATIKDLSSDNLELYTYWVNIQAPHEFNPIHTHDGIYSFAMWLEVPYRIEDELNTEMCKNTNMPRAGMFSFMYTNIFGEIREAEFPVDSTHEGVIFLFPSCLPHMVYPFSTSQKNRISISGNLRRKS